MKKHNEKVVEQNGRLTQHKRFVPYGTHPNFCFAKTSFIRKPLGEMTFEVIENVNLY